MAKLEAGKLGFKMQAWSKKQKKWKDQGLYQRLTKESVLFFKILAQKQDKKWKNLILEEITAT